MSRKPMIAVSLALAACAAVAWAAAPEDAQPTTPGDFQLPPGWTMEDMEACIRAATPGKQHELLARDVGEWDGKTTMWMGSGSPPMESACTTTVTPVMDGRYIKVETVGEMPGMGPFHGLGIYGFDNVSQQFVGTWIDSQSTGIMNGVGQLADDGKQMTWNYQFNCPITQKPTKLRQVETMTGADAKTLEMFGVDPKSGKEFKMMRIDMTRKG